MGLLFDGLCPYCRASTTVDVRAGVYVDVCPNEGRADHPRFRAIASTGTGPLKLPPAEAS